MISAFLIVNVSARGFILVLEVVERGKHQIGTRRKGLRCHFFPKFMSLKFV